MTDKDQMEIAAEAIEASGLTRHDAITALKALTDANFIIIQLEALTDRVKLKIMEKDMKA